MEILNDRWTLLIVRNALVGATRFDDFRRSLQIAPNMLADRLGRLAEEGILERRRYSERPVRHEYHATAKCHDLWPLLAAMVEWGDKYYAPQGPPRLLLHNECGHQISQQIVCSCCGTTVAHDAITTAPGPGHRPEVA